MTDVRGKTIRATLAHTPERGRLEIIDDAVLRVDADGVIGDVARGGGDADVTLPPGMWLLPGFVDLHIHAPQWPQLGKALDVPLEVWLQKHTFPLEARYADTGFARDSYGELVPALLAEGTTTAVYFATVHQEATRILADICLAAGQRAFVGKVAMDNPAECPDHYRDESAEASIEGTRAFIDYVRGLAGNGEGLVQPIITPRFIPSCTDEALRGLGALVGETGCAVQTHCSESDWEHGYVLDRYGKTDTEALDDFGFLTRRTVLAHSNFISDSDMERLRGQGAGVAHCPLSNVFFSNAVFPLRRALEKGVRVGLGTDISGGPSASIFENCRHAVIASRNLEEGVDANEDRENRRTPDSRIDFREALYLATRGGADVLDVPAGMFAPGMAFDAIVVDPATSASPIRLSDLDTAEDAVQKIVMLANRANVRETFVQGRSVHRRA